MSPLARGWGECYVNQAILSGLLARHGSRGSVYHCGDLARCLRKLSGRERRRSDDVTVLLIDYEVREEARNLVDRKLARLGCSSSCEGRVVIAYRCTRSSALVLVFREPPEDILASMVRGDEARKLRDKVFRKRFKSRASEYAGGLRCGGSGWVERLLCDLLGLVEEDLKKCGLTLA